MQYLTFVLGAGASVPYGLPTGDILVERVAQRMLRSSDSITKNLGKKLELYHPLSIDSYLAKNYSQDLQGLRRYKQYIALEIINSLQCGFLGYSPWDGEEQIKRFSLHNKQNWLRFLIPELLDLYLKFPDRECPVKIITFNYDLSIELYIDRVVRNSHHEPDIKNNFLRWFGASITHMYGRIGSYDWLESGHSQQAHNWMNAIHYQLALGKRVPTEDLFSWADTFSNDIELIGEAARANDKSTKQAKEWLESSLTVVFSGYAFHDENNNLLALQKTAQAVRNIIVGLYHVNARTKGKVNNLFSTGISAATTNTVHRTKDFSAHQPYEPLLNIYENHLTYDLLKDELELNKLYSY